MWGKLADVTGSLENISTTTSETGKLMWGWFKDVWNSSTLNWVWKFKIQSWSSLIHLCGFSEQGWQVGSRGWFDLKMGVWQCWEGGYGEGIIIISPLGDDLFVVNVQRCWLMMRLLSLFSESGRMLGYNDLVRQLVEKTSEVFSLNGIFHLSFQWWAFSF